MIKDEIKEVNEVNCCKKSLEEFKRLENTL